MNRLVNDTRSLARSDLDAKIKSWLSPPDPSTNYNAASAKHLDGTGSWFLEGKEFTSWRKTPSYSALWVYGNPGCGKTILSCALIKELRKTTECSNSKNSILFYFFDFNDVDKQSSEKMLRSLIFQLSRCCEDARTHLKSLFDENDNGEIQPSIQSLCSIFRAMLNEKPETVIILDALDECTTRNDNDSFGDQRLLDWLGDLQCRILVTSRRQEDIESSIERWKKKTILSMQESPVDEDICAYVKQYLRSSALAETWKEDPEALDKIETRLLERAAGM